MESAHSLLLNEEVYSQLPDQQKAEFIFEWLCHLKKLLPAADRVDIKKNQQGLADQLSRLLIDSPGPPTRSLLASCLAQVYHLGDSMSATLLVDKYNEIIRNKDDSPSGLPTRLAAIACQGTLYEELGRILVGSSKDTLANLLRAMKNAESQGRYEIMLSVEKILRGLGGSAAPYHRDIYKATRTCLTDRSMAVRYAAARCLLELQKEAIVLWTSELESVATVCFRAFEGSNSEVRIAVAKALGNLLATAIEPSQPIAPKHTGRSRYSLEEVMDLLSGGFLRGGAGFLRAGGDMLKGTSSVTKDVRIGIAQTCVVFTTLLGSFWLEANFPLLLSLLLELASHSRATQTPADAIVTRRCISFILRNSVGSLLGENAQINAAKQLCHAVAMQKRAVDAALTDGNVESRVWAADVVASQHVLVCCLLELGSLIQGLGTTATPLITDTTAALVDTVVSVLLHPVASAHLAASWCLRCIAVAMPSQCSSLLNRCTERLVALKSCPEAIVGYGAAIAALIAAVQHCPLGISYTKGKMVLSLAEDLLRSANQNSRIALQRTQAGWLLISALITLGPAVVEHHLPHLIRLWRCAFPPSLREQNIELRRGDHFTWQVTIEGRAGALCAIKNLSLHCNDLVSDDVIARLATPLACAVALLTKLPSLIRSHGSSLCCVSVLYKLRVYELLALLPPKTYHENFGVVMNQLVSDLSGQDSQNQPCSELTLLPHLCHSDDLPLVGLTGNGSENRYIEEQLQGSHVGGGSLDHDPFRLCDNSNECPTPLPPAVAVTAAAAHLFGILFPHIISAQRVQILQQFLETVNRLKTQKRHTVQTHVCAAVCSMLKNLGTIRASLGPEEMRSPASLLLLGALESVCPLLRCVAAEGLARMVQVAGDPGFTVSISLLCFDKLKMMRDAATRSGHALALGALHRYTGGVTSSQYLSTCLGMLFTLSQDITSPEVQAWSLHSISLLVELSGTLYRSHTEPSFNLVLRLLLSTPSIHPDVHHSLGRCLQALITCLGPDLQGESVFMSAQRSSCLIGCEVMQHNQDCLVQSKAISCLQQLHMFSPLHVNLASLVPALCANLSSSYLCLRRAVVACLRQLVQHEALKVSEHAVTSVKDQPNHRNNNDLAVIIKEVGLERAMFTLLDHESDLCLKRDIEETLMHMMTSGASLGRLGQRLKLCKDVLSASSDSQAPVEANQHDEETDPAKDDDSSAFQAHSESVRLFTTLRWSTRCFALQCVSGIVAQCENADPAHFNMTLASERRQKGSSDVLVLHLGELVRMAFMAAMDHSNQLRLVGLQTLLVIIRRFSAVPEPDFPGHVILEQYQANVGAALRPAFSAETPPDVTAKACQVCSAWIASGVVSDLRDLRRVHHLLASSLAKIQTGRDMCSQLYNEATVTMEVLAVLKAWAEVYIIAIQRNSQKSVGKSVDLSVTSLTSGGSGAEGMDLLELVQSDLVTLSRLWLVALQDYSVLTLPQEYALQLPASGGSFYTAETINEARVHYASSWAPILHATSLWLHSTGLAVPEDTPTNLSRPATPTSMGQSGDEGGTKNPEDVNTNRLHLILGIIVEFLCAPHSEDQMENITSCLQSLQALLDIPWSRAKIGNNQSLSVELLSVLHRLMVTRETPSIQLAVVHLLLQIVMAVLEHIREKRHSAEVDDGATEKETLPEFGEGWDTGGFIPGSSLVFEALELCLCVLVRKLPHLSLKLAGTSSTGLGGSVWTENDCQLVSSALCVLSELPSICSPQGSVSILPSVLYLVLGVLRELVHHPSTYSGTQPAGSVGNGGGAGLSMVTQAALQALGVILSSPMSRHEKSKEAWTVLLRSAFNTLLELWDIGDSGCVVDQITLLTALTVFLLSSNIDVITVEPLHKQCLQCFKTVTESKDPVVLCQCYQLLTSVFQKAERAVAIPYIHAFGVPLIRFLQRAGQMHPQTPEDMKAVLAGLGAMEALVHAGDHAHRPQLIAMLISILITFLLDENNFGSAPPASRALHEAALKDLMRLGPHHPAVFRSLITSSPHLKSRLETAVKGNQEGLCSSAGSANCAPAKKSSPSIILKTNFL